MADEQVSERSWFDAPWQVFTYPAVEVVGGALYMIEQNMPLSSSLVGLTLALVLCAALFFRSKAAWFVAVSIECLAIIGALNPDTWGTDRVQLVFAVVGLVLLSFPATRGWCRIGRSRDD